MAPLFEHYGVQLWMPETGGRVDYSRRRGPAWSNGKPAYRCRHGYTSAARSEAVTRARQSA